MSISSKQYFRGCPKCYKTLGYMRWEDMKSAEGRKSLCKECVDASKRKERIRKCPKCSKDIAYNKRSSYNSAVKRNSTCVDCKPKKKTKFVRQCPKCNKELKYYNVKAYHLAVKRNLTCQSCLKKTKQETCIVCNTIFEYKIYLWKNKFLTIPPVRCKPCERNYNKKKNNKRQCPECNKDIFYTLSSNKNAGERDNTLCRSCSTKKKIEKNNKFGLSRGTLSQVEHLTCRSSYERKYIDNLILTKQLLPNNCTYVNTNNGYYIPDFEFPDRFVEIKSTWTYKLFTEKHTNQIDKVIWTGQSVKPVQLLVLDTNGKVLKEEWYTNTGVEIKLDLL